MTQYTMSKRDEQMHAQRTDAEKKRRRVLEDAARIEQLINGSLSTGQMDAMGYIDFSVPLFRKYDDAVSAAIYYKNPKLITRKRKGMKDVAATRAEIEKRKLEYYVHETNLMYSIALAFAECRSKGTGFVQLHFDDVRGYTVVRHAPFRQVLIDPDVDNSPQIEDLMWMGRERVYGLDKAKERWPEHKWKDIHGSPHSPATESFHIEEDGITAIDTSGDHEVRTQRVRVLEVFLAGEDDADTEDAPELSNSTPAEQPTWDGDTGEEDKPEDLYESAKQVVYYEICSDGLYFIAKEKLQFVCDNFPLIPLRLTVDPKGFYADSIMKPYYDLARQAEELLRVNATAARKHSKTIMILDAQEWTDEEVQTMNEGADWQAWRKENVMRAANSVAFVDIGEPKEYVPKTSEMFYGLFRELSSLDALTLGGAVETKERSATGSALLDKRAERQVRKYADEFQAFVNRVFRTISQIDRSLMSRKQVQKIVGDELEVTQEIWPNKWDEDDILGEFDVIIEAGSMRYVSVQQQVEEMHALTDRWIQYVAQMKDMNAALGPEVTATITDKFFKQILKTADLLGISNPEEFLPTAEEILGPLQKQQEMEQERAGIEAAAQAMSGQMQQGPVQPQSLPPTGTPGSGAELTPQAASAMAQQILAGHLPPEAAPPEAAMMAAAMMASQQPAA